MHIKWSLLILHELQSERGFDNKPHKTPVISNIWSKALTTNVQTTTVWLLHRHYPAKQKQGHNYLVLLPVCSAWTGGEVRAGLWPPATTCSSSFTLLCQQQADSLSSTSCTVANGDNSKPSWHTLPAEVKACPRVKVNKSALKPPMTWFLFVVAQSVMPWAGLRLDWLSVS